MQSGSVSMLTCLALLLCAGPGVLAQESDPAPDQTIDRDWHAGAVYFETGDEVNCATGIGITGGVEARTGGPWIGAVGLDLFAAAPGVCTDAGRITVYRGERVDIFNDTELAPAPRLRGRLARTIPFGPYRVEPSLGMGLMYRHFKTVAGRIHMLTGWAGGSVALRGRDHPLGVEVEYGAQQVPFIYERDRATVRRFRRWKPLMRISLVW